MIIFIQNQHFWIFSIITTCFEYVHKTVFQIGIFHNHINMNFWERIDYELEYRNIDRKKLASEANFDVSNISKGIKNGNVPSADTALKISKVLNLDLEYLITGKPRSKSTQNDILDEEIQLFLKYRSFVKKLDLLDETIRNAVLEMIRNLPPEK